MKQSSLVHRLSKYDVYYNGVHGFTRAWLFYSIEIGHFEGTYSRKIFFENRILKSQNNFVLWVRSVRFFHFLVPWKIFYFVQYVDFDTITDRGVR